MFNKILYQNKAIKVLSNAIKYDKLSHAYIFYGADGVGKTLTALNLAKAVNCQSIQSASDFSTIDDQTILPCDSCSSCKNIDLFSHPDVKFIFPIPNFDMDENGVVKKEADFLQYQKYIEKKISSPWNDHRFDKVCAIRIEQIRSIQRDVVLSKFQGRKKVYIIEGFDSLTTQGTNAFLKTLEEPPKDTLFILIANHLDKLLPTVLSRCNKVEFYKIADKNIESYLINKHHLSDNKAKSYSRISNGNLENAIKLVHDKSLDTMDLTIHFLKIVGNKDDIAFLDWVEKNFVKGTKIAEVTHNFIQYLTLWVKDIQCMSLVPEGEVSDVYSITFDEHTDLLKEYMSKNHYYLELLPNVILNLDEYWQKYNGNINIRLILSQIYHLFIDVFNHTET